MKKPVRSSAKLRKPIRKNTPETAKENRIYNARVKVWLKEAGNQFCHACISRNEAKRPKPATQCHHKHGRLGDLLMFEPLWIPACSDCHDWIHNREPELARHLGLLAPKGEWNSFPKTNFPNTQDVPY